MPTAYRIARAPYADLTGEGARLVGGRWNTPGTAAVYVAENRALAVVESLVHVSPGMGPLDWMLLTVSIPDEAPQETWGVEALPAGWQAIEADSASRRGDAWLAARRGVALWVPSSVLPEERIAILNPAHPDHRRTRIVERRPFTFDARLLGAQSGM